MSKRHSDDQLANPAVPLSEWSERPAPVTGDEARELGRMLLDDAAPAGDVVIALRPGPPALGRSGEESPILRFRVPEEDRSALRKLTETTHRQQSDLLREGLALVLERYNGADAAVPVPASIQLDEERQFAVSLSVQELSLLRKLTARVESHANTTTNARG